MASKPRSEWSDDYRKRIESAERRGKTKTEARGHGHTPEHPNRPSDKGKSKYRQYEDKKASLRREIQELKEQWYGTVERWDPEKSERYIKYDKKGKERGIKELRKVRDYIAAWEGEPEKYWDDEEFEDYASALYYG